MFVDDLGFQDLSAYGSPLIKTPHIDTMAKQGLRLTDFYVASSVCSASRASLLTGRLGVRNGTMGVYRPDSKGLNTNEITLAETLSSAGYSTAMYGKWHLGDLAASLPMAQGFGEYFGIPYSNDMSIGATHSFAKEAKFREGYTLEKAIALQQQLKEKKISPEKLKSMGLKDKAPLFEGNSIIEYPADQASLTKRYFDRAIQFIDTHTTAPFFIYLTPAMPHVPLFSSADFQGKSARGLYGDVVEEIDWNMGRLLKHLKDKKLSENTIVIFSSDNGPWLSQKENGGSAGELRAGKFTNFEGGVRVPAILYWQKTIPAGQVKHDLVSSLDFFPTLAGFAKATLPKVVLDGLDIGQYLQTPDQSLERAIFYSGKTAIGGVRQGNWKYIRQGGMSLNDESLNSTAYLFDLSADISEKNNVIDKFPEKVKALEALIVAEEAR